MFTALLERVTDLRDHITGTGKPPAPVNAPGVAPQLVLSAGLHPGPHEGACFMELASFLAGERWSDQAECTHPVIAVLASSINDMLEEQNRHLLAPLIPAVIGTQRNMLTETQDLILCLRLAAWCTRQGLAGVADRDAAGAALAAAQAWADCPCDPHAAAAETAALSVETKPDYSCIGEAAALTARIACHTNDMNHQRPAALTAHARLVQLKQSANADEQALVRAKNREEHTTGATSSERLASLAAQNAVFAAACSPEEDTGRVELLAGFLGEHARLTDRLLPLLLSRDDEARLAELLNPPAADLVGVGPGAQNEQGMP